MTLPQIRAGIALILYMAYQCGTMSRLLHERERRLQRNELARFYQKSAEDHGRQPVGECQKLKRITSFRVPRASARGYLLLETA